MHKRAGKVTGKPVALSERQRTRFAVHAILNEIKYKPGSLDEKLAREIIAIVEHARKFYNDGKEPKNEVLKLKKGIHEVAMVNRYVYIEILCLDFT